MLLLWFSCLFFTQTHLPCCLFRYCNGQFLEFAVHFLLRPKVSGSLIFSFFFQAVVLPQAIELTLLPEVWFCMVLAQNDLVSYER